MGIKRNAFTFIEMLIVVGVVAIILPVIFAIFFILLRQQARIYSLQEAKKQGDFIIVTMQELIKNQATSIHTANTVLPANEVCINEDTESNIPLYFKDRFGNWFNFYLTGTIISSGSALTNSIPLTNSQVEVSNWQIDCKKQNMFSPAIVNINFNIRKSGYPQLYYQTKIKLKNY